MRIIFVKIIIFIGISFCNQSIFAMMVSYTHDPVFREWYERQYKKQFVRFILSTFSCNDQQKLKNYFYQDRHIYRQNMYQRDKDVNNIKIFKQDMIGFLLGHRQRDTPLILHFCSPYYKKIYNTCECYCCTKIQPLHRGYFESNGYSFRKESIIFNAIMWAARIGNFKIIDFLINPTIVEYLNQETIVEYLSQDTIRDYNKYNPNNFWKEFLKDPKDFVYSHEKRENISLAAVQQEWLEGNTIENGQEIAKILIKYHYVKDISEFWYIEKQSLDCNGCIYNGDSLQKPIEEYKDTTPLHVACRINDDKILGLLLEYMRQNPEKLDINSLDGDCQSPIDYAIQKDIKLVNLLIDAGANYDNEPIIGKGFLYKTIDTLDKLNFFNRLSKENQNNFIQRQLYLMPSIFQSYKIFISYFSRNIWCVYIDEEINRVLTLFFKNGACFDKKDAKEELFMDFVYRQYWERIKKPDNVMQLYVYFIFLRKTMIIVPDIFKNFSQALAIIMYEPYLILQKFLPKEVITIIMKRYLVLTNKFKQKVWELCVSELNFDEERELWTKYYQSSLYIESLVRLFKEKQNILQKRINEEFKKYEII